MEKKKRPFSRGTLILGIIALVIFVTHASRSTGSRKEYVWIQLSYIQ